MPYLSRYLLSNRLSLSQGKLSQSKQYSPRLSLQSLIPHFIGLPLTFLPLKQPGHFLSFRKRPRQIPQFIPHGAINSFFIDTFYQKNSISDVILAHEICHALQDQNFNIAAMGMRQPDNDDAVYAKLAMLEGDATILMSEWLQKNFNITNLFQLVGMLGVDQSAYTNAPYFLQQILVFPYIQGAAFVMEAMAENGMEGRDYVIKYPPRSTEQVLHPDKYFYDVDEPTTVTLPESFVASGEIWNRIYHNVFGEMGFKFLFDQYVPGNKSAQAATGWDGDRYAIYRDGKGGFALRWDSIWDTEEDAKEAAEALRTVMMKRYHDYQETVLESGWEWTKPNDEKENEATFIRLVRTSVFARLILSNNPDAAKSFISMK